MSDPEMKSETVEGLSLFQQLKKLPSQGHKLSVTTVAFAPDGKHMFTTGDDNTARRWDLRTGQVMTIYRGHSDSVWACAAFKQSNWLLTGARDALSKRWDVSSGECLMTYAGHEGEDPGVRCLVLAPNEDCFFTGSRDFTIRRWDVLSGDTTAIITAHAGIIWNIDISPDGNTLFSASADKTVKQFDVSGEPELVATYDHPDFVWSIAVSPTGEFFYTGCRDQLARKWNVATKECELEFKGHTDTVRYVGVHQDGTRLLTAGYDVTVGEWDTESGSRLQTITAHGKAVLYVAYSPYDGNIYSSSADEKIMRFFPRKTKPGATVQSVLVESAATTYTNISLFGIVLLIVTLIVQMLQLAAFAFNLNFGWGISTEWIQAILQPFVGSIDYLTSILPEFSFDTYYITMATFADLALVIFYLDIYGLVQRFKVYLVSIGWGKIEESKYKGNNPLEKGNRTATNKAEWEKFQTTTWIYTLTEWKAKLIWFIVWIASTLLAIPIIGSFVSSFLGPFDVGVKVHSGIALVLFIVMFLRLKVVGGDVSVISRQRSADTDYIGAWLVNVGGIAAVETMGPFTTADWSFEFSVAVTQVGFSIANNFQVGFLVLAILNLLFALLLIVNFFFNKAYHSLKTTRILFGLQMFQAWNMLFALVIVLVNDPDETLIPSIVWYVGALPILVGSVFLYTYLVQKAENEKNGETLPLAVKTVKPEV